MQSKPCHRCGYPHPGSGAWCVDCQLIVQQETKDLRKKPFGKNAPSTPRDPNSGAWGMRYLEDEL